MADLIFRRIALGSDHAGYELKESIKHLLLRHKISILDCGTNGPSSVDYPDYVVKVVERLHRGDADGGILVCGTGIGVSIVANKFPGIRAALCLDEYMVRMARLHNNANVLALGSRLRKEWDIELLDRIVRTWLTTGFEGGRHERRLRKILNIEKNVLDMMKIGV